MKKKTASADEPERCPNCDYCPECGRSKLDTPPACTRPHFIADWTYRPYVYPNWWGTTTSTITVSPANVSNVTSDSYTLTGGSN